MPLSILLCEGVQESPDARVLNKLLSGLCTVEPAGSKHRMVEQILVRRTLNPSSLVMGLRDPDFDRRWTAPSSIPEPWSAPVKGGQVERLGWLWTRKEIENYLIDPVVVGRALGPKAPPLDQYRSILERAADRLSAYTAARVSLTRNRIPFSQIPNRWGRPRGSENYPFPSNLRRNACRRQIRSIVERCLRCVILEPKHVLRDFTTQFQHHCSGMGLWRANYIYTYAGKDLLIQMESDLATIGFQNFGAFRERILIGIRDSQDDIASWLPEWSALRDEIQGFAS